MTRRAAAGLGRLLPLLLIAAAVVVVAGAALLAACGGSSGGSSSQPTATDTATAGPTSTPSGSSSPSSSPSAAPETTLRLYFLRDEKLGVAERRVAPTSLPATAAMEALLAGPTVDEKQAGLDTTVPAGTKLLGLTISGTTARVDLSEAFASGGGSLSMTARVAEVVYTLTRFRTVRSVEFLIEGQPVEALGGEGVALGAAQRRADWRSFEPAIFVESPGVGAVVSSPFVLIGTASVFEGSFEARLVDSSSRRIVNVTVQASRGAPGRGAFAKEIAFSTSAKRGTITVFDLSMEDGSRLDEVQIPVSFSSD